MFPDPGEYDPNICLPIEIPKDDPFWKGKSTCMEFIRSLASPNLKCSLDTKQQVTSFNNHLHIYILIRITIHSDE